MLKELYIENLAVIKQAVIPFNGRLNIFTGETGAGKSILINGINAVLGQRCTRDIVRSGCSKAVITALFTDLSANILTRLDELGIDHDGEEITITREISADGGSVARINSRTSSVAVLKEIGAMLINIHGQHDNQILLDSEQHIKILDSFGGDYTLLNEYRDSFRELQTTARNLGELKKTEHAKNEKARELKEFIKDVDKLEPEENEDEILEKEYETASNAEKIISALNCCINLISGEDGESASEITARAETEIEDYTDCSDEIQQLYDRLSAAEIEISDIADELKKIRDKTELDGQRYEYLKKRLNAINSLKRKYFCDCNELIKRYNDSVAELDSIESSSGEIEKLNKQKEELLVLVTERAKALSEYREKIAENFVNRVTAELEFLNMPNVVLAVKHEKGKLTVNGMDSMEFLISANLGEEPKPISKIASGGELSRIMLALKSVVADKDSIPTMIFDEIDTGVSGKAAQKIGIKLRDIGRVRQVLCVTHLSQIAVMADNHLMIEKKTVGERTETQVYQLDFEGRKAEIARIICGDNPSELMLKTAEAELNKAKEL